MHTNHRRNRVHELQEFYGDRLLTALTLMLFMMMFLIAPLQASLGSVFTYFGAAIAMMMIAGVLILSGSVLAMLLMASAFAMNVFAVLDRLHGRHSDFDMLLLSFGWLTVSLTLGWVVARAVFAEGRVSHHRIVGAVLLYILVALIFVALFVMLGVCQPGAFSNLAFDDSSGLASRLIYFSCMTLTTVGYGDIVPIHPLARSLCNLEAIFGQLYPAILIARLVTLQLQTNV